MSLFRGVNHITLLVSNKKKAEDFYVGKLGFEKFKRRNSFWLRVGKQFLHLTENSGEPVGGTFYHVAIEVENIEEYFDRVIKSDILAYCFDDNNALIKCDNLSISKDFFIRDPDGNLIEFIDAGNSFFNPVL